MFIVPMLLFTRSCSNETQKYYVLCPRRMVYHLTLTVRSGHSWIYAHEVKKTKSITESVGEL